MSTDLNQDISNIVKDNLDYTFFSWAAQGGLNPPVVERAEGIYLYTKDGKRILDFSSQLMNVNIGHGRKEVRDAVYAQMEKCSYASPSMATEVRGELGRRIAEITPGNLTKTLFTLGGAEANENAIKIARIVSGRHKILAQYRSYHGATYGAMSASGDPRKHAIDSQQMPNVVHFENPYSYRCPWYSNSPEECAERCIEQLERIIHYENPDSIAALIIEGESGTSGCIKYPPNYLKLIREICDKYGILLIGDEVMSGFGRTGEWFGFTYHGVTPDIMVIAKGLTSGYLPLGGMVVTDEIANHFENKTLPLGLTYSAHATLCASALAVLDIFEKENLLENARKMGKYMDQQLAILKEKHPCVGDVRNTGLLGCLEIVKNKDSKEPMAPWNCGPQDWKVMKKIKQKITELGMFTFVKWNCVFVAPPLIINEAQIDEGLAIISEALSIADTHCH